MEEKTLFVKGGVSANLADSNLDNLISVFLGGKKVRFDLEVNVSRGSGNEKHSVTKHVEVNTFCEVGEEAVEEENPIEIGQEALAEGEVDQVIAVMNEGLMETSEACSV